MKANEAPKKIYLPYKDDRLIGIVKTEGVKYNSGVDGHIEYIRKDAFIDKLECWMNENFYQYAGEFAEGILAQFDRTEDAIEDFRKYMEGE